MSIDKVTVNKRCLYSILTEIVFLMALIYLIYIGYDIHIMKWLLIFAFIFVVLNIPFLLSIVNEKITFSAEEIIHVLPTGKVQIYRWGDVCKIYLDSCGQYTNSMLIIKLYNRKKIKLPFYLSNYGLLKDFFVERGILGMYSDSPLYYYSNMENQSRYMFDKENTVQCFGESNVDISEVISKVKSDDYLLAADILNQKTDIGMNESFLYIRQMKAII
ncbi:MULTISPECIES: hypothetical protein [Butyrivibrio]|uniref:hypothetical protein n=1 Tax=Butyrivibrio TaxID=830 RepID=UPI00040145A3|nr:MULTISPECIES: hypothetical protein [Butyrivibrio]